MALRLIQLIYLPQAFTQRVKSEFANVPNTQITVHDEGGIVVIYIIDAPFSVVKIHGPRLTRLSFRMGH